MEYGCSICEYTSPKKENITKHFSRKTSCGEGIKEIIEIPIEIKCKFCNKNFSCLKTLTHHIKNSCKQQKINVKNEIKELQNRIKELEVAQKSTIITTTSTNSNIINNNLNASKNLFITINLRPYDDPRLADDMDDIFEDAWGKKKSIATFIERLHLSDEIPENNNMCITNLRTKLAKVFNGQGWVTRDEDTFLDEVFNQVTMLMDRWVKDKKGRKKYLDDFNEYLDTIGGKKQYNEDSRRELKLLFYDSYSNGVVDIKSVTKKYYPRVEDVEDVEVD